MLLLLQSVLPTTDQFMRLMDSLLSTACHALAKQGSAAARGGVPPNQLVGCPMQTMPPSLPSLNLVRRSATLPHVEHGSPAQTQAEARWMQDCQKMILVQWSVLPPCSEHRQVSSQQHATAAGWHTQLMCEYHRLYLYACSLVLTHSTRIDCCTAHTNVIHG